MPHKDSTERAEYQRAYRELNRERRNAEKRAYYAAHREEMHAREENRREEKRAQGRAYEAANREKRNAKNRAYDEAHHEEKIARIRAYHAANRAKRNAGNRTYRIANRDAVRARERAYHMSHHAAYLVRMSVSRNKRRTQKRKNGGAYTVAEWGALCDWFGNVCLKCGATGKLSADHVVPVSRGGSNAIDNLQPLCRPCNSSKHAKTIDYRDPSLLSSFLESLQGL